MRHPSHLPASITPAIVPPSDSSRSWAPPGDLVNVEQQWLTAGVTAAASVLAASAAAIATHQVGKRQTDAQVRVAEAAMPAAMKTAEAAMQEALNTGLGVLIRELRAEVNDLRDKVAHLETDRSGDQHHIASLEGILRDQGLADSIPRR